MQTSTFWPMRRSACASPTVTVLLPSPAGVGLIPVTSTSRPRGVVSRPGLMSILALCRP